MSANAARRRRLTDWGVTQRCTGHSSLSAYSGFPSRSRSVLPFGSRRIAHVQPSALASGLSGNGRRSRVEVGSFGLLTVTGELSRASQSSHRADRRRVSAPRGPEALETKTPPEGGALVGGWRGAPPTDRPRGQSGSSVSLPTLHSDKTPAGKPGPLPVLRRNFWNRFWFPKASSYRMVP